MTGAPAQQAPRWLSRSNALQPFLDTVCSVLRLEEAVALVHEEAGELPIIGPYDYASNACSITLECEPQEVWALLQ